MAKTAAAKVETAVSKTFKSRKAKAAVRGSHAQAASKATPTPPTVEGERATERRTAAAALATPAAVAEPEEVLRAFDLELQYGPCAGLTRLERWERAKQLGFDPPAGVAELLKKLPGDSFQISVFGHI